VFPALTTTPPEKTETTPPADSSAPLERRVGDLERGQERQDSKLDEVIDLLSGSAGGDTPAASADQPPAGAADITEQVRQAVRDVNAEAASKEQGRPAPEMTPREVGVKGKAKLQGWLFGGDPKK
jgi:hypothetical protein